jgi:hypothetical protein
MIIKTDEFELEISNGVDVYFGSKRSGQIFKKWEELTEKEKLELDEILNVAQKLLMDSEALLMQD